jgi:hypothetical protein
MKTRSYKEFPANIKNMAWAIYPGKKQIVVNGFKYFSLKELKCLSLNIRLSLPYEIFVAIDKA